MDLCTGEKFRISVIGQKPTDIMMRSRVRMFMGGHCAMLHNNSLRRGPRYRTRSSVQICHHLAEARAVIAGTSRGGALVGATLLRDGTVPQWLTPKKGFQGIETERKLARKAQYERLPRDLRIQSLSYEVRSARRSGSGTEGKRG